MAGYLHHVLVRLQAKPRPLHGLGGIILRGVEAVRLFSRPAKPGWVKSG